MAFRKQLLLYLACWQSHLHPALTGQSSNLHTTNVPLIALEATEVTVTDSGQFYFTAYHKGSTCPSSNTKIKTDNIVLIASLQQWCSTAKHIKLNFVFVRRKASQCLIFPLQVHCLINRGTKRVITGRKLHQKWRKSWKDWCLNGFEQSVKKAISVIHTGVTHSNQNKHKILNKTDV